MASRPRRRQRQAVSAVLVTLGLLAAAGAVGAASLESDLGRNDVRVLSATFPLVSGVSIHQIDLPERLDRLGYERVHQRPSRPGRYFWGQRVFWIYRRAHRAAGKTHPALLIGLRLDKRSGTILGAEREDGEELPLTEVDGAWLEPATLAESLRGDRAVRERVRLDDLPERVWRAVLAAEDARFFEHTGLDGRSLARAILANVKAGRVSQGGSTITQQLIKNRDLSPKRTLARKASEAMRALSLEAEYDKKEILEAYLNQVYLGHVSGVGVHGVGTAARVYFSKPAARLTLAEAALLAGMIQGPNRLTPLRHPDRAIERRDWVLQRMEELGWAAPSEAAAARDDPLGLRRSSPVLPPAPDFLSWVAAQVEERYADRVKHGRGFVVETTLDLHLQAFAERAVGEHLRELRRNYPALRGKKLSAALVALDARTGEVLAYVGGDPGDPEDRFDRARLARRQPGSAAKPLVVLEAFEDCGGHQPLHPASRVADEPLRLDLPSGTWEPRNYDGRFRGVVDLRTAVRESLNVPFVRIARWCGLDEVADTMRRSGLTIGADPPPSFALGSLETTPLELAGAFTVFGSPGRAARPIGIRRIERPGGRRLDKFEPRRRAVVHASTAYLVRELLRDAVENGTGRRAAIDGLDVAGKTGTSSSLRDAWFAGDANGIVAVAWVGLDEGGRMGLTASVAAAPLWKRFMEPAASARVPHPVKRPRDIVVRRVDPRTGLLVSRRSRRGHEELFRHGAMPRRKRWLRRDRPEPVVY